MIVFGSLARPAGERVITGRMWSGILFVSLVMAAGTLYTLDAALPGGSYKVVGAFVTHNGVHHVDPVPALQCIQRSIGRRQRVSPPLAEPVAMGRRGRIGGPQIVVVHTPFLQRAC
jgi:hypothetical protein